MEFIAVQYHRHGSRVEFGAELVVLVAHEAWAVFVEDGGEVVAGGGGLKAGEVRFDCYCSLGDGAVDLICEGGLPFLCVVFIDAIYWQVGNECVDGMGTAPRLRTA